VYLALEADLSLIPVLNKIDLPAAEPERRAKELMNLLGCKREEIIEVSAKTGKNVDAVLDAVIERTAPPTGRIDEPLRALIFDSVYDEYRGVIVYTRVVDGRLKKNDRIAMMGSGAKSQALELGHLNPAQTEDESLETGQIGYIVTNLKSTAEARVGDTITDLKTAADLPLPGYKKVTPFVYAGIFPVSSDQYQDLKDALEKLALNDASLVYEPENSQVLGFGFRAGFLGLLHLDIVKQRLERHYDLEVIITNPSTDYRVLNTEGEIIELRNANELPDPTLIEEIREPWVTGEIIVPSEYIGNVIQLIVSARGLQKNINYMDEETATVSFEAPLANLLTDFYDQLKSSTSGFGTLSYELNGYRAEDLVRLDILVAGDRMDSLSVMTHRKEAESVGRDMLKKLKDIIPRQLFEVALQAAIGGKIIAREDIRSVGKNVTAGLYGGDVSRKKKQLAKQKAGKARMKKFGNVDIPPEAFTVLITKDE
jgi:GTP-binding protein LepA